MVRPFRDAHGARLYLRFAVGRLAAISAAVLFIIMSSVVPSQRRYFGGAFLIDVGLVFVSSLAVIIFAGLFRRDQGNLIERISAPFRISFLYEAVQLTGRERSSLVRQFSLAFMTPAVPVILIGLILSVF